MNKVEEKVLVARGGDGGMASNQYVGQKGDAMSVTLDLKVISDIGFVGYYRNENCLLCVSAYSQYSLNMLCQTGQIQPL